MLTALNSNFYIIYIKCFGYISYTKYIAKINYCYLCLTVYLGYLLGSIKLHM